MNNFDRQNAKGKIGETAVAAYLASRKHKVEDVSNNPCFWGKDIDFLLTSTTGDKCSVEVKCDTRMSATGNLLFEIGNEKDWGYRDGWIKYCEADYICFYDAVEGNGYILDWKKTKPVVKELSEYKYFHGTDGDYCEVYLMPIWKAKKHELITHQFSFKLEEVA